MSILVPSRRGSRELDTRVSPGNGQTVRRQPRRRAAYQPASLRLMASRLLRLAALLLKYGQAKLAWLIGKLEWFRLRHLDFVARADDIFIVTYPRSGTTWMQMILYQLTSDGSMDFPHIAARCPWFERSIKAGRGFERLRSPRLFKSHLAYPKIPKGHCKYIYVVRDGKDVAVSYYHLYRSHNGYKGSFSEFFERFLQGQVEFGSWFQHVKGWWLRRHDPRVLFLHYEDVLADLERSIKRIIAFCGLQVAPSRLPGILERCSFEFMKKHEAQFDHLTGELWEQGVQFNTFLRQGRAGSWQDQLSPEQCQRFDRCYSAELGRTGLFRAAPAD